MKIKTLKYSIYLLTFVFVCISCEQDDDDDFFLVPDRDRTEQQVSDKDSILNYLSTHYYNSGFFESGSNHKYTEIVITKLLEGEDMPADHTLLIQAVETREAEYLETQYEYYILNINQGGGDAPTFTDQVRVRYEGSTIYSDSDTVNIFDFNVTPSDFFLQADGVNLSTIKAWQLVFPEFNAASDFESNNGTIDFSNFGLGVMFVPSGLAYFASAPPNSGIAVYENLIFKFELLQVEVGDPDGDGIPSYIEDIDLNLDVSDDDTDEDSFPNFIDRDDDNDGVLTINELMPNEYIVDTNIGDDEPVLASNEYERSRNENAGIITINTVTAVDSNNDGTPDYLDVAITINYNEDEDS